MNKSLEKANFILYTTLLFWISIIIWANLAVLEEVIKGNGVVVASSKIKIIQNLEGGIIRDILVEPGEIVFTGKPLINIDTTRFESELLSIKQEITTADQNLKLLKLEKEILDPLVTQGAEAKIVLIRLLQKISEAETFSIQLKQKLLILEDKLKRAIVRSPVEGIVNRLLVNTSGGVVQPGENLLEIVPIDDELLVEVEISPKDIAYIESGQKAIVKLTAFDYSRFGSLIGKVKTIGADSIQKKDGTTWYICQITISENNVTTIGKNIEILPGMVAQADIVSGERSIISYLLEPVIKIKSEAFRER